MAGGGMWPNGFTDNTFAFFRFVGWVEARNPTSSLGFAFSSPPPTRFVGWVEARNPTSSLGFAIAQPNLQKMAKVLSKKPGFWRGGKTVADESGLRVTLENLNNWFVA